MGVGKGSFRIDCPQQIMLKFKRSFGQYSKLHRMANGNLFQVDGFAAPIFLYVHLTKSFMFSFFYEKCYFC